MSFKERRAIIYSLPAESTNALLDQIEVMRDEGGIDEKMGNVKESLISRCRYLERAKEPISIENLMRMSQKDAQAAIYKVDLGTATALKAEASARLGEMQKKDGGFFPLRNVDSLLNRRMFFLKSESKAPEHVGVEDLLYLNQENLAARISKLDNGQVNNLIVEMSMVMHDGQREGQEKPAKVDGRHERVFSGLAKAFYENNKEVGTGGYSLSKLERLDDNRIKDIVDVLPGSAVVKLYGNSVERLSHGKLHGSEQKVHDALKHRVEHGLEIEKVMNVEGAQSYIKHYGQSDVVELLNQLPGYEEKTPLGLVGVEEEIAVAINERAGRLNEQTTLRVADEILKPLAGQSGEDIAVTMAGMSEAQRDAVVNFTYGLIASETTPRGFDQETLVSIVNDGVAPKGAPEILADLMGSKIGDVRTFLASETAETLEALQDVIASADRSQLGRAQENKLDKIAASVEQNLENARSQGAAVSAG